MMTEEEQLNEFERYDANEMSNEERTDFEKKLAYSESLRSAFSSYKSFAKEIEDGFTYRATKKRLASIHTQLYQRKKSFFLRPIFLIPSSVAAGILLLINLNSGSFTNQSDQSYSVLSNDNGDGAVMQEESNTEDTSAYGYQGIDSTEPTFPPHPLIQSLPRGTAFQLSSDGYFITARHVVETLEKVMLQQRNNAIVFAVNVVYIDSLLDFALLKCTPSQAEQLGQIPYNTASYPQDLGEEVFTLGYPKSDVVYTKGVISSETGYQSDTNYYEISLPSNAGQSGAPLFNGNGEFIGIITAKRADQESVTYVLKPTMLFHQLETEYDSSLKEIKTMKNLIYTNKIERIKLYRAFIFEVH